MKSGYVSLRKNPADLPENKKISYPGKGTRFGKHLFITCLKIEYTLWSCPFSVVGTFAGHLLTYSEHIGRYDWGRSESLTRLHRRVGWSDFSLDTCCLWITGVPVAQWVNC